MTCSISVSTTWVRNFTSPSERPGEVYNGIIGGGQNNCVFPGTNHSSIFSGQFNKVSGSCSSVLGGSGNNDGGFPYTGMYGCNLTASLVGCAFWVNELIVPNMPVDATGTGAYLSLPSGALYTCVLASTPSYLGRPVFIK